MTNAEEKKKKEYPKKKKGGLIFQRRPGEKQVVVPIVIICRADGECVVDHRKLEDIIFPKERGEKVKKKRKKRTPPIYG